MAQWFKRLQFWKNDPREKHGQTNLSIVDLFAQYRSAGDVGDNYQSQALEGYVKNVVALYVINTISLAVSNIPFFIRVGGQEVETSHPISKLIRRPNPGQTYKTLIREIIMNRMISGNCYLEALQLSNGSLRELYSLRPDRVRILTNSKEVPTGYEYRIGDKTISFPIDPLTRVSDLLHMKEPNPLDDCYGLSPIRAASFGISHHNSSSQWNVKLLDNYAKPAG
ncbi:MAG: phage portal protein, partial [Deltaproteobacteria bacterium]|nr:phage portal protein [Deltaproteobacteria bacterium]